MVGLESICEYAYRGDLVKMLRDDDPWFGSHRERLGLLVDDICLGLENAITVPFLWMPRRSIIDFAIIYLWGFLFRRD